MTTAVTVSAFRHPGADAALLEQKKLVVLTSARAVHTSIGVRLGGLHEDLPPPAMRTVNIHEARTHLSRLVDRAAKGEPFIIAKSGKPMVKVVAIDAPAGASTHPQGPFDRILIAQSIVEGITLLTVDDLVARYPRPVRRLC